MATGPHDRDSGQHLFIAAASPAAPTPREAQIVLLVRRLEPRVGAECVLPLLGLSDDRARGKARPPSAVRKPPAWSKCRWLTATMSTVSASKPASCSAGRIDLPVTPRCARWRSSMHSPMPVSISTRPAGVSTIRQLSAWLSVLSGLISASTSRSRHDPRHRPESRARVRGERARLDERDARSTAEVAPPIDDVVQRRGPPLGFPHARRLEVLVELRLGRAGLALVFRTQLA